MIVIAEELSPATVEALGPDFEIRFCDGTVRKASAGSRRRCEALIIRSATRVDAEVIAAAGQLKVIARAGVGLDNVDVRAATQAGVMVVNAPTSNIVSAAEMSVGLLLATARNIPSANAALRSGEWRRSRFAGSELYEKVAGIVGLGRIGILVAQRLSAFGMRVIAYDPYVPAARAAQMGVRSVALDELLRESDFISVHLPKTPETVGPDRRAGPGHGEADGSDHQRRAWRHRRRARACARPQGRPGCRRGHRRLLQRAVRRLAVVRLRLRGGHPTSGRLHRRGPGEGGCRRRALGAAGPGR